MAFLYSYLHQVGCCSNSIHSEGCADQYSEFLSPNNLAHHICAAEATLPKKKKCNYNYIAVNITVHEIILRNHLVVK